MSDPLDNIKLAVRDLRAYSLRPDRVTVKINQNENPFDFPVALKEEALRRLSSVAWARYPEFVPQRLRESIAAFAGWTPDGVLIGNGSNELIQATLLATITSSSRVLICEPTFSLYRQLTRVLGGESIDVPLTTNFEFDIEELVRGIEEQQPAISIICSPNNPTGCVIANRDLARVLEASRGLVVVDEAYFQFAESSAVALLHEHRNLLVFRTFSKAMALAGLRIGYLLASPELTAEIGKTVLPYNLNVFSQTIAEVALENYEADLRPLVEKIVRERDRLFAAVQSISGLVPMRSSGNFMVVRSRISPGKVFDQLLRRDILIRDVSSYPMLEEYFRISVGTPAENDLLISALTEIFA